MVSNKFGKKSIAAHRKLKGKIETRAKAPLKSIRDLSIFYTPGVGAVSSYLAKHPEELRAMTLKRNTVAIVSDGSAVLGLGNLGPAGAIPVMEGKAMIFKEFAGVDAFPIVLATQDPGEIVETVQRIAPVFGGINLEDISSPRCFEIERRLIASLDIPVMHDDQHGTAIAVLAGIINALKVTRRSFKKSKFVISGAGAAGTAVAKILLRAGARNILVLDSRGIVARDRRGLDAHKRELARLTNPRNVSGTLETALRRADVFVGVSVAGALKPEWVRAMREKPIVFAMANPVPEIMPDEAKRAGAYIVATGRSDFPNQINNSLVFPGVFRGALDHGVKHITDTMKVRAARALAALVRKPTPVKIIPGPFDRGVVRAVSSAIR